MHCFKALLTKNRRSVPNNKYFSTKIHCDVIVIGAGIGGTSIAYELSQNSDLKIIVLEQEYYAGYHSTGRAAGLFSENYGTDSIKLLTMSSRKWFENPPLDCNNDIISNPILTKCGVLNVSSPEYESTMISDLTNTLCNTDNIHIISKQDALTMSPLLNPQFMGEQCVWEPTEDALDIATVHQSYLRGLKNNNIPLICNNKVEIINKSNDSNANWEIITHNCTEQETVYQAQIIVNAAGAWADDIAVKSGLHSLDILPLRRCCITFKPHNEGIQDILNKHIDDNNEYTHPWVIGIGENAQEIWYLVPQYKSGLFLCSPCNTDLDEACDAQPTDFEIALAVDRIETYTKCKINKIEAKWAGLRCHSQDYNFILGPDTNDNSFFWCAALAGQGIQAAPSYSQLLANIIVGKDIPPHIADLGFCIDDVLPSRFMTEKAASAVK